MTIATEITRIKTNISNTYAEAKKMGAQLPKEQNSNNLVACIKKIPQGGGGGGEVIPEGSYKIVFIDYDGTVLSKQILQKGEKIVEPPHPEHERFTFTRWNRDFDTANAHLLIGACYKLTSGYDNMYQVRLDETKLVQNLTFASYIDIYPSYIDKIDTVEAKIDWGDGTIEDVSSEIVKIGQEWRTFKKSHTYSAPGDYFIQTQFRAFESSKEPSKFEASSCNKLGIIKGAFIESELKAGAGIIGPYDPSNTNFIFDSFDELVSVAFNYSMFSGLAGGFYRQDLESLIFLDNDASCTDRASGKYHFSFIDVNEDAPIAITSGLNKVKGIVLPPGGVGNVEVAIKACQKLEYVSYPENWSKLRISKCNYMTDFWYMHLNTFYHTTNISNCSSLVNFWGPTDSDLILEYLPRVEKLSGSSGASLRYLAGLRELKLSGYNGQYCGPFESLEKLEVNWDETRFNESGSNLAIKSSSFKGPLDLSALTGPNLGAPLGSYLQDSYWCSTNISEIIFPQGTLENLGVPFKKLSTMTHVTLPASLKTVTRGVDFSQCPVLKSVRFPVGVQMDPNNAQSNNSLNSLYFMCPSLEEAYIFSNGNISGKAISRCPSIKKVWLPKDKLSINSSFIESDSSVKNPIIFTDAPSRPSSWVENFNVSGGRTLEVRYGSTYEQYLQA